MLTCGGVSRVRRRAVMSTGMPAMLPEFPHDKLGLVEAAAAFSPGMERHGAKGIDRIRVSFQICGEKTRDIWHSDSHVAIFEIVDYTAGAAMELVGRSHAVEGRGAPSAPVAELRNARAGAEEAVRTLEGRQVELAVGAQIAALALADNAILRQYEVQQRSSRSPQHGIAEFTPILPILSIEG